MSQPSPKSHAVSSLLPPIKLMASDGFSAQACLQGTGLSSLQLEEPGRTVTLQQEVRFYRNLLELTADPTIGLRLGAAFVPQRYGIFGYALLSSATLGHAMAMAAEYVALSFSWFELAYRVSQDRVVLTMADRFDIDPDVRNLLHDRDCAAVWVDLSELLGQRLPLQCVALPHDGYAQGSVYEAFFQCPVEFSARPSRLEFSAEFLARPLPHHDALAAEQLLQQCQLQMARMGRQNPLVERVRQFLLGRPGQFPELTETARQIGLSERTLRRQLAAENSSYQQILDEVRLSLAKQYLSETRLPLQEIALLLGYSEPGNFSHAFKRWTGASPRVFRQARSV